MRRGIAGALVIAATLLLVGLPSGCGDACAELQVICDACVDPNHRDACEQSIDDGVEDVCERNIDSYGNVCQ